MASKSGSSVPEGRPRRARRARRCRSGRARAGRIHDRRKRRPPGSRWRSAPAAEGCRCQRRPGGQRREGAEDDADGLAAGSRASITLTSTCSSSLTADSSAAVPRRRAPAGTAEQRPAHQRPIEGMEGPRSPRPPASRAASIASNRLAELPRAIRTELFDRGSRARVDLRLHRSRGPSAAAPPLASGIASTERRRPSACGAHQGCERETLVRPMGPSCAGDDVCPAAGSAGSHAHEEQDRRDHRPR